MALKKKKQLCIPIQPCWLNKDKVCYGAHSMYTHCVGRILYKEEKKHDNK